MMNKIIDFSDKNRFLIFLFVAVALLLGHDDRRAAMGGAGRARVSRDYSEAKMVDAFEAAATVASDRARW